MQLKKIEKLDQQIRRLQQALTTIGPMRPGTLTRQYRQPQQRQGGYYQLSYTLAMKSRTEYVRLQEVEEVRREIAEYRRYKKLTAQWIALAVQRAQLRRKLTRSNAAA